MDGSEPAPRRNGTHARDDRDGTEPPRLVASDVDGTLLDHTESITDHTRAAVHAAVDAGATFVLATGRPPRWIPPVVEQLGLAPLAVCANGAVLYDSANDRVLHASELLVDELAWLADVALTVLPGSGLAAERVGRSAHDAATPQFVSEPGYQHAWLNPDNTELGVGEVVTAPAIKLLIRHSEMTSHEMAERLRPVFAGKVDLTYSTDNGLVEISPAGVTKASGLRAVADRLGIALDGVVAFGDMPNDIPMLEFASCGVAMGNAADPVKRIADEVTATNRDDGVARVLDRWFG